jgi:predicted nucleic acid-binding Zn ribbon protein
MSDRKKSRPTRLGDVVPEVLGQSGLAERLEQAGVIVHWPAIVGREIAKVTQPVSVDRKGVLTVAVTSNAWMTELSMMAPELLRAINEKAGSRKVVQIRWRLVR